MPRMPKRCMVPGQCVARAKSSNNAATLECYLVEYPNLAWKIFSMNGNTHSTTPVQRNIVRMKEKRRNPTPRVQPTAQNQFVNVATISFPKDRESRGGSASFSRSVSTARPSIPSSLTSAKTNDTPPRSELPNQRPSCYPRCYSWSVSGTQRLLKDSHSRIMPVHLPNRTGTESNPAFSSRSTSASGVHSDGKSAHIQPVPGQRRSAKASGISGHSVATSSVPATRRSHSYAHSGSTRDSARISTSTRASAAASITTVSNVYHTYPTSPAPSTVSDAIGSETASITTAFINAFRTCPPSPAPSTTRGETRSETATNEISTKAFGTAPASPVPSTVLDASDGTEVSTEPGESTLWCSARSTLEI
ncbi:hypothetical protein C8R43DRAFT_964258 [Mycena crocata]|nr:hypothetical protein C8R43DRAFT_964258 [Mycena crocata]